MQTGISIDILCINIRPQLDQSLHVFNMHGNGGKMQSCRAFAIRLGDTYAMAAREDENWKDSLIPLSSAVHDCLVT